MGGFSTHLSGELSLRASTGWEGLIFIQNALLLGPHDFSRKCFKTNRIVHTVSSPINI